MATPYVMVTGTGSGQKVTSFPSKAAAHKAGNAARAAGKVAFVHSKANYAKFIKPPSKAAPGRSSGSSGAESSYPAAG